MVWEGVSKCHLQNSNLTIMIAPPNLSNNMGNAELEYKASECKLGEPNNQQQQHQHRDQRSKMVNAHWIELSCQMSQSIVKSVE
jgi:hypothetical protein